MNFKIIQGLLSLAMTKKDTLRLKNEIFYSAKLAFHMAIDKYSMYDLEVPSGQQLLDEIKAEDG